MAQRPLESNGCPQRSKKEGSRLPCDQVARGRKVSKFSESSWMDGKNFADTWTTSRRSTSPTPHPGIRGTGTRAPSRWYAMMMMIAKLDRCEHEEILSPLRELSQVFDKNKVASIPSCRRTREYGKEPFDEALRAELEWQSHDWKTYWSQPSSSSSSQQWWQHEHQRLSIARTTKTLDGANTKILHGRDHNLWNE